jgi:hypothetical protein
VHHLTVSHNLGLSGNRGPFARVVEEAKVDVRVVLQVVCLAGLGVGMEDEVDAVTLLCNLLAEGKMKGARKAVPLRPMPYIC